MKNIRLLINLYPIDKGERLDELILCLKNNISNPLISEIVVLDEGFPRPKLLQNPKVTVQPISSRLDFTDFYDHLAPNGFNLISNNDIWFDSSLKKLASLNPGPYDLLCLTRTEADGRLYKDGKGDTQDSWLFIGKPEPLKNCTFPMGKPGCENHLAFLFFMAGYRVLNPAKVITTRHEHKTQTRNYNSADRIPGPYLQTQPVGQLQFHVCRLLLKLIQKARVLRIKTLPPDTD